MAYNHKKGYSHYVQRLGLIFIPVPKNGSSSFRAACTKHHLRNEEVNFIESSKIFENTTVVSVVNHDLTSRFCSGFLEILKRKERDPWGLTQRVTRHKNTEDRLFEMIEILESGNFYDAHIESQCYYLTDNSNNLLPFVDEYIRLEQYDDFLKKYFRISIRENQKPKDKKQEVMDIIHSNNLYDRINEIYKEDYYFLKKI